MTTPIKSTSPNVVQETQLGATAKEVDDGFEVDFKMVSQNAGHSGISENEYTSLPCLLTMSLSFRC